MSYRQMANGLEPVQNKFAIVPAPWLAARVRADRVGVCVTKPAFTAIISCIGGYFYFVEAGYVQLQDKKAGGSLCSQSNHIRICKDNYQSTALTTVNIFFLNKGPC